MLDIENLVKSYGKGPRANDDVSLTVRAGEVVCLLGHNGAGKTTLVNQVAGLAKPTSGTIRVNGCDPVADPATVRRMVAVMPQAHAPLAGVSPRQAITAMGRIRGLSKADRKARADALIDALDLGDWADTVGERLSGGVRRLTAYAMAVVAPVDVVMLDEPTNDVDPVRRRLLWEHIRGLAEAGAAVLLVTHNVVEAERSVDRVVVLDSGKVVAQGTPDQLRERASGHLRLELNGPLLDRLPSPPAEMGATQPTARSSRWHMYQLEIEAATHALAWAQELRAASEIEEFSLSPISLEDVYMELVNPPVATDDEKAVQR